MHTYYKPMKRSLFSALAGIHCIEIEECANVLGIFECRKVIFKNNKFTIIW